MHDRRYGRRCGYDDDDDDDGENAEMEEVHDSTERVTWVDADGDVLDKLELDEKNLLLGESLYPEDPSDRQYEGYMGNSGPTLEFWYKVG